MKGIWCQCHTILIVSALGSTRIALTVTKADALTVAVFPLNDSVTVRVVSQDENPSPLADFGLKCGSVF